MVRTIHAVLTEVFCDGASASPQDLELYNKASLVFIPKKVSKDLRYISIGSTLGRVISNCLGIRLLHSSTCL